MFKGVSNLMGFGVKDLVVHVVNVMGAVDVMGVADIMRLYVAKVI